MFLIYNAAIDISENIDSTAELGSTFCSQIPTISCPLTHVFDHENQEKQVKKFYLALAAAPVPVGIISHYMRPVNVAPRLVSEGNSKG